MPSRIRDRRRFHGRANVDVSALFGGMENSAGTNPEFVKPPDMYNAEQGLAHDPGMAETMPQGEYERRELSAKAPYKGKQGWRSKLRGEGSYADELNAKYFADQGMADYRGGIETRVAQLKHQYNLDEDKARQIAERETAKLKANYDIMKARGVPITDNSMNLFTVETMHPSIEAARESIGAETAKSKYDQDFYRQERDKRLLTEGDTLSTTADKAAADAIAARHALSFAPRRAEIEQQNLETRAAKEPWMSGPGFYNIKTGQTVMTPQGEANLENTRTTTNLNRERIESERAEREAGDVSMQLLRGVLPGLSTRATPPSPQRPTAPVPAEQPPRRTLGQGRVLDRSNEQTIRDYLRRANNDPALATKLARDDGWIVEE